MKGFFICINLKVFQEMHLTEDFRPRYQAAPFMSFGEMSLKADFRFSPVDFLDPAFTCKRI
jgi:hypothetical protein